MIRVIVGGVGSGKTCAAVHEILHLDEDTHVFANFPVHGKLRCTFTRLRVDHIIAETVDDDHPKRKPKLSVNFGFWKEQLEQHPKISIFIDEAHNVMNSRRSMSKWNVIFTDWITQIRKVLGEHETNHLTLITQRISAIDVVARDLAMQVVALKKHIDHNATFTGKVRERGKLVTKKLPVVRIIKHYFNGRFCTDKYGAFLMGAKTYDARSVILVNPVFAYYDSYALVDFGSGVYV